MSIISHKERSNVRRHTATSTNFWCFKTHQASQRFFCWSLQCLSPSSEDASSDEHSTPSKSDEQGFCESRISRSRPTTLRRSTSETSRRIAGFKMIGLFVGIAVMIMEATLMDAQAKYRSTWDATLHRKASIVSETDTPLNPSTSNWSWI